MTLLNDKMKTGEHSFPPQSKGVLLHVAACNALVKLQSFGKTYAYSEKRVTVLKSTPSARKI